MIHDNQLNVSFESSWAIKIQDIKNFTSQELKDEMEKMSVPSYRADQILNWIYKKNVQTFSRMTNIPHLLLNKLEKEYYISNLELIKIFKSRDKSKKFLFKLPDSNYIETVIIPAKQRRTVCISTQIGCKFKCKFCASGMKGFVRDLSPSEMINQILCLPENANHSITNIVFMGMGEPLDNYENLMKAIHILNEKELLNCSLRRMTISTSGLIPGIQRLINSGLKINLSISLHAADDQTRNQIMPINKRYPLKDLLKATEKYFKRTGRKITLEYILFKGINDSPQNAYDLASVAKQLRATVNLMNYNQIPNTSFQTAAPDRVTCFVQWLTQRGVNVTYRKSCGADIHAACGQLSRYETHEIQTHCL